MLKDYFAGLLFIYVGFGVMIIFDINGIHGYRMWLPALLGIVGGFMKFYVYFKTKKELDELTKKYNLKFGG